MKIEKNRHLQILDGLMKADAAITAKQLAFLSDSSVRTVKDDIALLSASMEEEKIARILSFKAKGYTLEVIDQNNYARFKDTVEIMLRMYYNRPIETMDRRLYIIHSFLAQDLVSVEQICQKLYLSASSVRKEIEWIRTFLSSYDLKILSTHDRFYYVEGKEENIRSALVEIHCSQYHEFQQTYIHEGFNVMFYQDKKTYEDIRHALLAILRDSDIAISDIAAKKIPTYICLVKSRLEKGKTVSLSPELARDLEKTYDYQIARKIVSDPIIHEHCEFPEEEILQLAAILLTSRDIDIRSRGTRGLNPDHIAANATIYRKVMEDVDDKLGRSLYNTEFYRFFAADTISLQLQLFYRHHFDSTKRDRLVTYVEGDEDLISPVPMEMARIMIRALEERYGEPVRDPIVLAFAQLFEKMLKKVTYPYKRLRLLACSTEGLVYTQNMIENMISRFRRYIDVIEAYNLYEMRKLDFGNYDALIHSGSLMYYRYPLKSVSVREVDYRNTSSEIFDSLFKYGYDRSRLEQLKKILSIYPDSDIRNVESFIERMCYRYGKDYESQMKLFEEYKEKNAIMDGYSPRLHSFLTFFNHEHTGREFIDIYLDEDMAEYDDALKVRYVIIASLDPNNSVSSLKIDNHIIQFFIQVEGSVEKVLQDKDQALDEMFDQIIKINFIGY
ncbi:MAG: helix-turn-helix domain-containing protein [Erysipelotrichaceae bacterium]|nr:helix-turn-helix domain-containing protein [Erysipelotrichaceae bacterium]